MSVFCFLVALLACLIGSICGMGGGVIIKPVLDASGFLPVAQINFFSCCTVLGMTLWSVTKSLTGGESRIDLRLSTPLAAGAAVGGLVGKRAFSAMAALCSNAGTAGGVQAALLLAVTLLTMLYTLHRDRITRPPVRSPLACGLIGMCLGILGTFLGIGGGPFNMAVLYYFFSMPTKTAAQNSLYIILFSQLLGLVTMVAEGSVWLTPVLLIMIVGGVAGSKLGRRLNRRLSEQQASRLFLMAMVLVMAISAYNICRAFLL